MSMQTTGCRALLDIKAEEVGPQDPLLVQTIIMLLQGLILIPDLSHFTDIKPRKEEAGSHPEEGR